MPGSLDLPSGTLDSDWVNREWTSEYLCEWVDDPDPDPDPDPDRETLRQLAEHLADLCEDFDQRICHVRNWWGVAIPMTHDQHRQSTAFAREQMEDLGWLAQRLGYTQVDWSHAVHDANMRLDRLMKQMAQDKDALY